MGRTLRFAGLATCFFFSGLAALIYQTAWTREFAFVFGTSELAIAVVLAAYMAGLAVGSWMGGRIAQRVRRPVRVYGLLELGIGSTALAVPLGLAGTRWLLVRAFGGQVGLPPSDQLLPSLFGLASSFLVMMLPTALMGATLPVLARYAVRSESEIGPRVGLLYAINTAGAVLGTLVTAFLLLSLLGLRGTIWSAVAVNVFVFLVAASLSRGAASEPGAPSAPIGRVSLSRRWVLPLICASGFVSFSYEVLWTRLLSHLLGGSIYAFAVMLSSVLTGIALGSAVAARLASSTRRAESAFAVAQLGAGLFSFAAFLLADRLAVWFSPASASSSVLRSQVLVSFGLLLAPALCIGLTYPLAVRILASRPEHAGPASARAYAWNTSGAILGALGCAYLILPGLFFTGTLRLLVALNMALAIAALLLAGDRRRLPLGVAVAALAAALAFPPPRPWHLLETAVLGGGESLGKVAYFSVGRSATVLLGGLGPGAWRLRTNGLPEALIVAEPSMARRVVVARWLGALPALIRPETHSMLSVGLGGGVHLEAIPRSVKRIDVVELEPRVVAADRTVSGLRARDPLADPRVRVVVNDARSALLLSDERYDAIVAQASHPWTTGASHLYTREFFELAKRHMTKRGVFVQWMGMQFVDAALLRSLVATLHSVWPDVRVYSPVTGGMLFAASDAPLTHSPAWIRTLCQKDPAVMGALGIAGPIDLDMALLLDEPGSARFAAGAPLNTDDRNALEMRSPRVMQDRDAVGNVGLPPDLVQLDAIRRPRAAEEEIRLTERLLQRGELERARAIAANLRDPQAAAVARALVGAQEGPDWQAARTFLHQSQAFRPEAQAQLALVARNRLLAGVTGDDGDWLPADGPAGAMVEGWTRCGRSDWQGLRALEPRLAAIAPDSILHGDATWLRAQWRLQIGSDADREAAAHMLDRVMALDLEFPDWAITRAELYAAAGRPDLALASLGALFSLGKPMTPEERRSAERLIGSISVDAQWHAEQARLLAYLRGRAWKPPAP